MRKILLLTCVCAFFSPSFAQEKGKNAVQRFGNSLSQWCKDGSFDERSKAISECAGKDGKECLVYDSLMMRFARIQELPSIEKYQLPSYMTGFQAAMRSSKGISVKITDVEPVPADKLKFDRASMSDEKRNSLYYISCNVSVSGLINQNYQNLFYIRKGSGQISQIGPYEEVKNSDTGRKEIIVNTSNIKDWDHIAAGEFNSIEVSYGYSSNFPLNIGVSTNFSYFNIGVDYGMNFSEEQLAYQKHTNYATSTLERGKYWYLMATPGVYLRYASIDCGLGNVFAKYNYNYESVYTSTSNSEKKNYFIMKPKLTFHIPIPLDFSSRTEKLYISPHVGYNYVPKCSALNCWEVGIGVRFRFETY